MSEDIVEDSIKCLANMEIKETTYQVARNVVLDEIERLNNIIDKKEQFLGDNIKRLEREVVKRDNIIKEVREFAKLRKEMYERQENVVGQEVIISLLEILDKENVKAIPPEVIGTNGEDGGLFDYGDKGE